MQRTVQQATQLAMPARPAAPTKAVWLPALASIRFLGAMVVVFAHFKYLIVFPPGVALYLRHARPTMSLFFVLSGFIVAYSYADWFQHDFARAREFYRARLARIVPMHVVGLLLMTPVTLAIGSTFFGPLTLGSADRIARSWLANLFVVHIYIQRPGFDIWNQPAWTLSTEIVFYALSPWFIAVLFRRLRTVAAMATFVAAMLAAEVALLVAGVVFFHAMDGRWRYDEMMQWVTFRWPIFRAWEYLIGCTLAVFLVQARGRLAGGRAARLLASIRLRNWVLGTSVALIFTMPLVVDVVQRWLHGRHYFGAELVWEGLSWYALYTPIFAALVLVLAAGRTFASPVLDHPWLVSLGDATYSLYLLHWIPRQILLHVYGRTPASGGPQFWWSVAAIVLCVAASLVTYRAIELPAQRWLRGRRPARASSEVAQGAPQRAPRKVGVAV